MALLVRVCVARTDAKKDRILFCKPNKQVYKQKGDSDCTEVEDDVNIVTKSISGIALLKKVNFKILYFDLIDCSQNILCKSSFRSGRCGRHFTVPVFTSYPAAEIGGKLNSLV